MYREASQPTLVLHTILLRRITRTDTIYLKAMQLQPDKNFLITLAHTKMPFGKYKDYYLIDLPEYYVVWYHNKGFPKGKLGDMLQTVYELKLNGLEDLIRNIKRQYPK